MNFPAYNKGQWVAAATAAGASVPLVGSTERAAAAKDLLLWNPGPNDVRFIVGSATTVADNDCPTIPAGAMWAWGKGTATHIATMAIGGAQNVQVFLGEGS